MAKLRRVSSVFHLGMGVLYRSGRSRKRTHFVFWAPEAPLQCPEGTHNPPWVPGVLLRWHRPPKCLLSAPFLSPREAQWWSKRRDLAGCDRGAPRAPRFVKAVRRIALDKNPKQDQAPGASKMDFSGLFQSEWSDSSSQACGSVV